MVDGDRDHLCVSLNGELILRGAEALRYSYPAADMHLIYDGDRGLYSDPLSTGPVPIATLPLRPQARMLWRCFLLRPGRALVASDCGLSVPAFKNCKSEIVVRFLQRRFTPDQVFVETCCATDVGGRYGPAYSLRTRFNCVVILRSPVHLGPGRSL